MSFKPISTSKNVKDRFGEILTLKINQALDDFEDRIEEIEGIKEVKGKLHDLNLIGRSSKD